MVFPNNSGSSWTHSESFNTGSIPFANVGTVAILPCTAGFHYSPSIVETTFPTSDVALGF